MPQGTIATIPKFSFSANGVPMVLGTLTVYLAGTTTPTDTWQDQALTTLNTNPVVLDARGECVLWLDSTKSYKFVLKNAAGVIQWTQDNIAGADAHLRGDLAATSGASLVGYLPAGTGAVAATVQAKLRESVSVKDFGAVGDGTTNDSAAFQACIDSLPMGGRIYVPTGNYRILTTLNLHSGLSFYGDSCVNNVFGTPTYNEQSSHIFLDADAGKLFTIPANTQIESIYFTDLSFSARLNPTIVPRGTVTGFHFEGEAPYGMKHFGFTRCEFSNFGSYAIRVYDPTGGTGIDWNSNPGYMDECTFYYNTIGIEFDTDNADYWRLTGVGFIGAAGSFGIMCRRVGTLVLNQCGGGGGTMIAYIGAARDSLTLICCQFEAGDYMIHLNDTMATLQTYMPITLISCVVESPILLNKPCHLISQGTRWVNNLEVTASGVVVDMLFDSFLSSTAINLAAGSYVKNFLTHGSDLPIGVAGTILDGYRHSGPRIAGASPIGVTAPLYIGEEYYNNVAGIWYKGSGTTVNAWAQLN